MFPFHQIDAVLIGQGATPPAVVGDLLITARRTECLAYDARTLKLRWRRALSDQVGRIDVVGGELVVCGEPEWRKTAAHLFGLDPKTGATLWSVPRQGAASHVVADAARVYASLAPFSLSALDRRSHRVLWSTSVPPSATKEGSRGGVAGIALESGVLLVNADSTLHALDANRGRMLWSRSKVYTLGGTIATSGVVWVGGEGLDVRSGRSRWRNASADGSETQAVDAGRFIGIATGTLRAVEPRTGRLLWSHSVGPKNTYSSGQGIGRLGGLVVAAGSGNTVAVDSKGKARWSIPSEETTGLPVWSHGGTFVAFDGSRLLRYASGPPAPLPTNVDARRIEAVRLVARFDLLDAQGRKRLSMLGDDAFAPVLEAYLATCAEYDVMSRNRRQDTYPLYSRYHDLGAVLRSVVSPRRTPELLTRLDGVPSNGSARPELMTILAKVAHEDVLVPRYLKDLENQTPGFEMYESNTYIARTYILRSHDPRAIAFLIGKLKDPKADSVLRQAAYTHLAGTGGEVGVRAVLAERRHRTLLPPLAFRLNLEDVGSSERDRKTTTLLDTKTDPKSGKTYALATSGALGSQRDLWILERNGSAWTNPLFVGVSLDGISSWAHPTGPPPVAFGKTAKELAEGAWFATVLAHRAELAQDVDGDGLTDSMEARLGTDPKRNDTDGDGDPDGIDPFPNAVPRPLGEGEKILAAVFEARYHDWGGTGPGVLSMPPDLKPFEMVGWKGPVIWKAGGKPFDLPLEQHYEQGIALLEFGSKDKGDWETRTITWNRKHSEAQVTISTYFGGLSGDGYTAIVRRFGDDWVVVSLDMAYVS